MERLLQSANYRVRRNARVAQPRQTDLFAAKNGHEYLIELKWQDKPVHSGDVGAMRDRLSRAANHLIGVVLSMSGFTDDAIKDVEAQRSRIVLLFGPEEVAALFHNRVSFEWLIQEKRDRFVRDSSVFFYDGSRPWGHRSRPDRTRLPAADLEIVLPDGTRVPWIVGKGTFGPIAFVHDLPDVNWIAAQGSGVGFDLDLGFVGTKTDICYVMDTLNDMRWLSRSGRFTAHQTETCWYGVGAAGVLDALDQQKSRYIGAGSIHHTEQITYFDTCEHGFFTLAIQVSAAANRVFLAKLSAQLYGIPLDIEPFRRLAAAFMREESVYFRPLARSESNRTQKLPDREMRLQPVAFLRSEDEWVAGIIVRNPFYKQAGGRRTKSSREIWPLPEHELLCCRLSSWHEWGDEVDYYYLRNIEIAHTDDATVFCVIADWHDLVHRKHGLFEEVEAVVHLERSTIPSRATRPAPHMECESRLLTEQDTSFRA